MARGVFVYTEQYQHYDMGPQHPMKPARLRNTWELLDTMGALSHVEVVEPTPCPLPVLSEAHEADFIRAVDRLSCGEHLPSARRYGFGTGDNPIFPGMWEAALLYTGGSLQAADAVAWQGHAVAMNIAGGLHHAHWASAAGFCIFNDCVVAIQRLRRRYERVAYIDIDVHHGDGVQEAFYADPSVLTVSLHESGRTLFPGTGQVSEIGAGDGEGFSVNVPFWPGTTDEVWLDGWRRAALPLIRAFGPEAIVLQLGTDVHTLDPLAHLELTAQGWLEAVKDVARLGCPVVGLGGGGYNPTTVPRMWALAFGVLYGVPLPDVVPAHFSRQIEMPFLTDHSTEPMFGGPAPAAVEFAARSIDEVERLLFPRFGLKAPA